MITAFVPTLNASRTLEKTLKSILNQTIKPQRVIVIDSGSTDNTCELAKNLGVEVYEPKHWQMEFLGLAKARNRILELIDTELLLSVDSDIILEPKYLEKMLPMLEIDEKIAGVAAKQIELNRFDIGDAMRALADMKDLHIGINEQLPEFKNYLLGSNSIYKVNALKEVGKKVNGNEFRPFNDDLNTNYEDVDIGEKLTNLGYKLYWTPEARTYHLQKDTLKSYIDRAYRYRVFKWDLKGAFNDYEVYSGKIEHNINFCNMGIELAKSKNRNFLIFPMAVLGFNFFIRDAIKFLQIGNENYAGIVYNSCLVGLDFFNNDAKREIILHNSEFLNQITLIKSSEIDERIVNFFAALSENSFEICTEEQNKDNTIVNFTDSELKSSSCFIINVKTQNYNLDELIHGLAGLNPANVDIHASDAIKANILEQYKALI